MALEPVIAFDPVMAFEPDMEFDDDMLLLPAGVFAAACAKAAPLSAMQTATTGAVIFTERIIASLRTLLFERGRSIVRPPPPAKAKYNF